MRNPATRALAKSPALCLALLLGMAWGRAFAQIPSPQNPPRLVNDFAQVMSAGEVKALEDKLLAYNDSTSTVIVIVTVRSLQGYDVQQFAFDLAEKWQIYRKDKQNVAMILAAIDDRKMTIQTGYGLEAGVPDAYARRIIANQLKPSFKQGDYYRGFDEATDELARMMAGTYKGDSNADEGGNGGGRFPIWVIVLVIVFIFIWARRNRGGGTTIGGNRNRGGGVFPPVFFGGLGGGRSSWGGSSGGFGGFGGGNSFGGGGASGDW